MREAAAVAVRVRVVEVAGELHGAGGPAAGAAGAGAAAAERVLLEHRERAVVVEQVAVARCVHGRARRDTCMYGMRTAVRWRAPCWDSRALSSRSAFRLCAVLLARARERRRECGGGGAHQDPHLARCCWRRAPTGPFPQLDGRADSRAASAARCWTPCWTRPLLALPVGCMKRTRRAAGRPWTNLATQLEGLPSTSSSPAARRSWVRAAA